VDGLTRAFAHLPDSGKGDDAFTIHLWDGSFPSRNGFLDVFTKNWPSLCGPRGSLVDYHGGRLVALYQPGPDILHVVDLERNIAFYWKRDLTPLPYYEVGSPLRSLLHVVMRKYGLQFVHGGAVGHESGGVLLAGKGGSGKSTSVLACLDSGLQYASDDYCMSGTGKNGEGRVHSLYNTAKLRGDEDLARFPKLAERVWNPVREGEDKATIFLQDCRPEKLIAGFPLRAILVPHVAGVRDTTLGPCSAKDALLALAPTTLAQLPDSGSEDMQRMVRLVRTTPCYRLQLGTDLRQIPEAIERVLAQECHG
jgi:hypothetical protein